jgi:UDP-galactopyranose mutase
VPVTTREQIKEKNTSPGQRGSKRKQEGIEISEVKEIENILEAQYITANHYVEPYQDIYISTEQGKESYYPVNDEKNSLIFRKYQELAQQQERVLFGGRLAQYTYADMDDTVAAALKLWEKESL